MEALGILSPIAHPMIAAQSNTAAAIARTLRKQAIKSSRLSLLNCSTPGPDYWAQYCAMIMI